MSLDDRDRETRDPEIQKMLVVSTRHLPPALAESSGPWGEQVLVIDKDQGFFVYVPSQEALDNDFDGMPWHKAHKQVNLDVLRIMRMARIHECSWILFDVDGPTYRVLPTWNW